MKATDNQIRAWAYRHDFQGSLTDLRAALEDAATLIEPDFQVHTADDGIFLIFKSPTGKSAMINVEKIAQTSPPITAEAIREWIVLRKP